MDDTKRVYREGEQAVKKAWREADGEESPADTVGNVGDEVRKQAGNAGDRIKKAGDKTRKELPR